MMWQCVAEHLDLPRAARLRGVCRDARDAADRDLRRRWRWSRDPAATPAEMWGRLLEQGRRPRRCMRCGGEGGVDVAVVCDCARDWFRGCVKYHPECCECRAVRHRCVVVLARCWLCRKWVMALRGSTGPH